MPEHGIDVLHTDGLSDLDGLSNLADHIYTAARGALDSIPGSDRDEIYVVSLFVYDEQDDPRHVLIHELEYYDEIAEQNLAANPVGLVDDFDRFCRGG